MIKMFTCKF